MSDIAEMYFRAPPVARTIATACFVSSIGIYMGFIPYRFFVFNTYFIFKLPPEPWRFFTSFLLTGPQLGILLDPYFVYSYTSQLEVGNPRFSRREDVIWYLGFVSTAIILIDYLLGFQSGSYLQALIIALAYTCTQDQRGMKATFYFFTIPAQLVPYTMILVTMLINGPSIVLRQLCGLLAAHLYDFLSRLWPEFGGGTNYIATPAFMTRLVRGAQARIPTGGSFTGSGRTAASGSSSGGAASASGSSSGPLPDAWRTRGRGQRLGGD